MIMIREIRYLEAECFNATLEAESDKYGVHLRTLGRRLLELTDEYLPSILKVFSNKS